MTSAKPNRRAFLKGSAVTATMIGMPFVRCAAAERSLRVATFGGNFKSNFINYIFPEFERTTGIRVEPVLDQNNLAGLMKTSAGAQASTPPADLVTVSQEDVAHGAARKMWRSFATNHLPNLALLDPRFLYQGSAGVEAIGGMAWYQTLIVHPKDIDRPPSSWKILWDPALHDAWGLASGSRSTLFEITAATWFGGNDILATEDGIRQVIAKIAELKPNVKLWWASEGDMQTAFEEGKVTGGMYFHDAAGLMARNGVEVMSVFPAEGGVLDFASWCQPAASTKIDEAQQFIDFMCTPAAQAMITRKMGTAPLIGRKLVDLTDAEFKAASSDIAPIDMAVQARIQSQKFMDQEFARILES